MAILLLLQIAFGSFRPALLTFFLLPMALVGGAIAVWMSGRVLSLGSLVGFLAVFGIAARNGILMISHFERLEREEGVPFGPGLVIQGAKERLAPIMMTALATGLALVPLVVAGSIPAHEIEHPMAIMILGGLVTATLINLLVLPSLYRRLARASAIASLSPWRLQPLPAEHAYFWVAAQAPPAADAVARRDLPALLDVWNRTLPAAAGLLTKVSSVDDLLINTVRRVDCRHWFSGRLVLISDAAHAMAPNLGQGANSALVDMVILADQLRGDGRGSSPALRPHPAPPPCGAYRTWQACFGPCADCTHP